MSFPFFINIRLSIITIFFCANLGCSPAPSEHDVGWKKLPIILQNINAPTFPERDVYITDYGAIGDSTTDCTESFKKAIDECNKQGGGRVVVPEGIFLTGAIHLKSNINLYISKNARILFAKSPDAFLPVVLTRFEGVECMNYSPLIYAYEVENIAVTGRGTLDGNADNETWWPWKGKEEFGWKEGQPKQKADRDELFSQAENGIGVSERVYGEGRYLRPSFIQPYKCKNILIDSVTIIRSPMWEIHPVLSENITVQNVKISTHGPNNDGCNPESSKNVLIKNCFFDTGDDCIAIKSGRNADGRRINIPSENIIVQNCVMKDGHGGVVIGSEMSGSCRNVFIEDCIMDSPNLERALRIKTNSTRGGSVENVYMRNISVGEVSDAVIKVNFDYERGDVGEYTPTVKNIFVEALTSKKSKYALSLAGYERSPISNLFLKNCAFDGVKDGNKIKHLRKVTLSEVYINNELIKEITE